MTAKEPKENVRDKTEESMKTSIEYLDWYFTCDDGTADKDAQKAWFELRGRIKELEEKLRLLEYGDQDIIQSGMMPAT